MFALKKFAEFWLMPIPFSLALLVLGLWLTRRGRRRPAGRALLVLGTGLLLVLANSWVSARLVQPLEGHYPAVPEVPPGAPVPPRLAACRFVVVLGSGNSSDPALAALDQLATEGLGRITEAVRLWRLIPDATLIVSGPPVDDHPSHASVLAAAAESLGVPRSRIRLIDTAEDTHQEALAARALVGGAPVALVTSAVHMPRAVALFRHAGVDVLPCPTDFTGKVEPGFGWESLRWNPESLDRSTKAVRERLGLLWERLRGQAD